jgi:hypothetical protein
MRQEESQISGRGPCWEKSFLDEPFFFLATGLLFCNLEISATIASSSQLRNQSNYSSSSQLEVRTGLESSPWPLMRSSGRSSTSSSAPSKSSALHTQIKCSPSSSDICTEPSLKLSAAMSSMLPVYCAPPNQSQPVVLTDTRLLQPAIMSSCQLALRHHSLRCPDWRPVPLHEDH